MTVSGLYEDRMVTARPYSVSVMINRGEFCAFPRLFRRGYIRAHGYQPEKRGIGTLVTTSAVTTTNDCNASDRALPVHRSAGYIDNDIKAPVLSVSPSLR